MHLPGLNRLLVSPFKNIPEYNEKLQETAWAFQQAVECYIGRTCITYAELAGEVLQLKAEAVDMYQGLRIQIGRKGGLRPVKKALVQAYVGAQYELLDAIEQTLVWMTCRTDTCLPEDLVKQLFLLVDAIIDPVEELIRLTYAAQTYFKTFGSKHRQNLMDILQVIEQQVSEARQMEGHIQQMAFKLLTSPADLLYVIFLSKNISTMANHAGRAAAVVHSMMLR